MSCVVVIMLSELVNDLNGEDTLLIAERRGGNEREEREMDRERGEMQSEGRESKEIIIEKE